MNLLLPQLDQTGYSPGPNRVQSRIQQGTVLVFGLILCSLLLSGCGKRESKVDRATREGMLLIGNGGEPKALDPHLVTSVGDSAIMRAMFEGLVTYHPSNDATHAPGVAERWEANDKKTVWTFYLRKNAKWSNGDPVTAHDFVYSYHRILHPEMGAPYASMLYFLRNAKEYNTDKEGKVPFEDVGVKALDDYTLELTLPNPTPFLPDVLKHTTWLPVHKPTIEKYGGMTEHFTDWQKPGNSVSNGAFQVTKWRVGSYVRVEKNPYYWDKDNVKLNGVEFYAFENSFTEERAFRNGLIHKTYVVPPNLIPLYKEKKSPELRLEPYIGTYFYRFNCTNEVTGNVHLRRALSAAIDREQIVKYVTQAGEIPAYAFTPPTEGGYQPPRRVKFDPAEAKEHLKNAGYAKGSDVPAFSLFINTSESHTAVAIAILDMWKTHLGIDPKKVTIKNQEWKVYQVTIQDLKYDVARSGWIGDYLDPKTFLSLFTSDDTNNHTGWANDEYDRLFAESDNIGDEAKRFEKLEQLENVLLDELPITPIYWYTTKYLLNDDVRNWNPLLLDNHPFKAVELIAD
ncbi:MAG: peptide ABC transporter substrate-binding protein [Verrucomicrobiales bacterium]|nr:peptide ABC transporter substrate-binding protein [Verrucomicrobiales bacterium]